MRMVMPQTQVLTKICLFKQYQKKPKKRRVLSRKCNGFIKIYRNYEEARVKLTNTQLNKLKSAARNKTRTTLRINKKNLQDE